MEAPIPTEADLARLPAAEAVVHRYLIERNADEAPDHVMVRFEDGSEWTARQVRDEAYRAANGLAEAGVTRGSRVGVMLENGPDFLRAWWGSGCLGAVLVPLNLAWRGRLLARALDLADPLVVVCAHDRADGLRAAWQGATLDPAQLRRSAAGAPALDGPLEPWDIHHLQFTSGTTGPSKASRNSYFQLYVTGSWATVEEGLGEQDVFLIDLPLFHQAAMAMAATCLATRSAISVRSAPAMTKYWQTARDTHATVGFLLSTMVPFLMAQPVDPAEREHNIRMMIAAPLPLDQDGFRERFGVEHLITAYGSTEVSATTLIRSGAPTPVPEGTCGRERQGWHIRLVDDHDQEVAVGEPGELTIRTDLPWTMTTGYEKDPEATAIAYRNGWFHTGDLLRRDEEGYFYFVDRKKDSIRRRGENVSSFEVEEEVAAHPAVAEVACVAARLPDGVEDDVKVWLVPAADADLDLEELLAYLVERMPYYMVPRFYELVTELPKTPTMKVQKHLLRERGNSASTWDIEAAGYRVTRHGLRAAGPTG